MSGVARTGCPVITELTVQELGHLNRIERPANELEPINWCGLEAATLLVVGERSPAFLPALTDLLQELLPDAERVLIKGASHVMHEEQPDAVNAALQQFLGRMTEAPGPLS